MLGNEVLVGQGTTRGESWGADRVVIVAETRVAVGEARGFHFLVPDVRWVDVKNEPRPLQQLSAQRVEWEFAGLDAATGGRPYPLTAPWNRWVGEGEATQQDVVYVRQDDGPYGAPPLSLGASVIHLDRLRARRAPGLPRSVTVPPEPVFGVQDAPRRDDRQRIGRGLGQRTASFDVV